MRDDTGKAVFWLTGAGLCQTFFAARNRNTESEVPCSLGVTRAGRVLIHLLMG